MIPEAPIGRVLGRVATVWHAREVPHHLVYGMTGSGKTTLIKALLGLCPYERVLVLDPKAHPDPVWDGPPDDPDAWGRPIASVPPQLGAGRDGGGPAGLWYRLTGTPDRKETAARFSAALLTMHAEGHAVLVLDDVRETCKQLGLRDQVDSVMSLGRSAGICAILSTTELGWVTGRGQGGMVWVGHTSGLEPAKAGAGLLGWRGPQRQDECAAIGPHEWIFSESQPGSAGPVLIRA